MTRARWTVLIGRWTGQDIQQIFRRLRENFGLHQAQRYRQLIRDSMSALYEGPAVLGSRSMPEISPGARIIHIGRKGRRGRHLLLYRDAGMNRNMIGRVLHDAMDIMRQVPDEGDWT